MLIAITTSLESCCYYQMQLYGPKCEYNGCWLCVIPLDLPI